MNAKTCILIRSGLLANGLIHYIRSFLPDSSIEIFSSFSDLLNSKDLDASIIILDLRLINGDQLISIEKLREKSTVGQIIGIYERKIADRNLPYFDHLIHIETGDGEIRNLFEKVYFSHHVYSENTKENRVISPRESEILKFVALGFTNKEIADQLNLSTYTVMTHRKNIVFKLGIKTIAGLTVYSILNNIIKAEEIS